MINEAKMNVYLWVSHKKKKLVKVSFVTINVKLQKYTCIRMMKTHYDTPKSVIFEVHQPMKTSCETMSEQTFNVQIFRNNFS